MIKMNMTDPAKRNWHAPRFARTPKNGGGGAWCDVRVIWLDLRTLCIESRRLVGRRGGRHTVAETVLEIRDTQIDGVDSDTLSGVG